MKTSLNLMLAAGMLSVGFVSTASANTDVYLCGSSAFRAADTNAIIHLFGGTAQAAYTGSKGLSGSTNQLIQGTYSGVTYDVHTCWTGSLSGLISVGNPSSAQDTYLTDTGSTGFFATATAGSGATSSNGPTGGGVSTETPSVHSPDGCFSDVYATSTAYNNSSIIAANSGKVLGVVPFVFVGNPDLKAYVPAAGGPLAGGQVTNINATDAKQLYSAGLDMAQLTGNPADDADTNGNVLPVGRNADSGTRFVTFAETGFNPIGGVNLPTQYAVSTSGSTVVVAEYPQDTLFAGTAQQTAYSLGASGYPSGGNEQSALNIPGTSTAAPYDAYMIGTLGESDAANAVSQSNLANNGYFLSYNGQGYGTVTYTTSGSTTTANVTYNRTALEEGTYTLWGYEHEYYVSGDASAVLLNAIAVQVRSTDAGISGDFISNMACQRNVEGGPISYVGIGQSSK